MLACTLRTLLPRWQLFSAALFLTDNNRQYRKRLPWQVSTVAAALFADADAEFGTLRGVKARLERWKARHREAYDSAYASLSVPALFAPFVRQELLTWDPLYDPKGPAFDGHTW